MPRLARLLLPLAAFALGYAAGQRYLPAIVHVERQDWPPQERWSVWLECNRGPGIRVRVTRQATVWAALAGACADWWRGARRTPCHQ